MSEHLPESGEIYNDAVFDSEVLITDVTEDQVLVRDVEVAEEKGEDGGNVYPHWMWEHNHKVGRFTSVEKAEGGSDEKTFDQAGESGPNWGAQEKMDEDVEENEEMYQTLADEPDEEPESVFEI